MLQRSDFEADRVEKVPCRGDVEYAIVLVLSWQGDWHGVGHYELVTYNHVIRLPRSHPFLTHLDELHMDYMSRFSRQYKREKSEWKPTDEIVLEG